MAPRSRRLLAVAGLALGLLVLTGYRYWGGGPAGAAPVSSNQPVRQVAATNGLAAEQEPAVPPLRLDALAAPRPEPASGGRNPFRLQPPPTPSGTGPRLEPVVRQPGTPVAAVEPAPQPIALKFIGLIDEPGGSGRVAVLSDGRFVFHGREGAIIDGRYRVVRIGVESVVMEHVDGRGRQTIRLSGS